MRFVLIIPPTLVTGDFIRSKSETSQNWGVWFNDAPKFCLRLFSCRTSKEGESFIVKWNESEGSVKRTYLGLGKRSVGVVQFDTMKNKFVVVGDE
ncbi:unnamed protein product [Arabidopsis halleri]